MVGGGGRIGGGTGGGRGGGGESGGRGGGGVGGGGERYAIVKAWLLAPGGAAHVYSVIGAPSAMVQTEGPPGQRTSAQRPVATLTSRPYGADQFHACPGQLLQVVTTNATPTQLRGKAPGALQVVGLYSRHLLETPSLICSVDGTRVQDWKAGTVGWQGHTVTGVPSAQVPVGQWTSRQRPDCRSVSAADWARAEHSRRSETRHALSAGTLTHLRVARRRGGAVRRATFAEMLCTASVYAWLRASPGELASPPRTEQVQARMKRRRWGREEGRGVP